jgi:hypothetical protein
LSSPAGDEPPRAILRHTERCVRKATAFRGRANKTALPTNRSNKLTLKMFRGNIFKVPIYKNLIFVCSSGQRPLDKHRLNSVRYKLPLYAENV